MHFFTQNPNLNLFGGGAGDRGIDGWTEVQTNCPFNFFKVGGITMH